MQDLARTVRIAARAIGRAGLAHAYGHCSARVDEDTFLVSPPRPLAMVEPDEDCIRVPIKGALPDGVLGEVRLHQQIYARRPEAGGVVRFMGPNVMVIGALNITPRILHGFGTYFLPQVGIWHDVQLIRDDTKAHGACEAMGQSAGLLMRGNGAVVAGASIEEAAGLAFYLEDMCRIELAVRSSGLSDATPEIPSEEAELRATRSGRIFERMWEHLSVGDPELARKES